MARLNTGMPDTAMNYHGEAIAAAVIGGASFSGGGAAASSGGASSSAAAPSVDYHDVKAKIMIIGKNGTDPFTNWLLTAAQNTVNQDYPNVEYVVTNLDDDPSNITTLLDQCILDGYDGVLIQKGSNSISSDAWYQAASAEGLKICAINAYANDGVASASYADDYGMAEMMAKHMTEILPEGANVVFIKGPDGNQAAMDRVSAFREHLFDARPDLNLLDENFSVSRISPTSSSIWMRSSRSAARGLTAIPGESMMYYQQIEVMKLRFGIKMPLESMKEGREAVAVAIALRPFRDAPL